MDEIQALIGNTDHGITSQQWARLKKRFWSPNLDSPLRGTDGSAISITQIVGTESGPTLVKQFASGEFTSVLDTRDQEFLLAIHLTAILNAPHQGARFPEAFLDRLGDPELTRGDQFMYEIFDDALLGVMPNRALSDQESRMWLQLAVSPNKLMRLLALRGYRRVTVDPTEWLEFYNNYVYEEEPLILKELVRLTVLAARPEGATLLAKVRESSALKSDPNFNAKLDLSIAFLQSLATETR